MRNVFFHVPFLAALIVPCVAQNSLTITSDERDLSRPISTLINQIRQHEKVSITYEDPRYVNSTDIEDVTAEVSKGSDLDKTYGPRILVPKGHPVTFVYVPAKMHGQNGAKATIERMLQEYASLGGPAFAVIGDGTRLHVVPREILDAAGARVHQESIFESRVNVPPAQRNGGELLQAICDQIQKQTGYEVGIGPSVPGNYLARYQTATGIHDRSAREAIAELLDLASMKGIFDWDLYYDPGDKEYMLNFAYVGPVGKKAK